MENHSKPIALVLVLVLIFTLVPFTAAAAEEMEAVPPEADSVEAEELWKAEAAPVATGKPGYGFLQAPANFKAVSAGYNSVKLTWDAVPGAESYILVAFVKIDGQFVPVLPEDTIDVGNVATYTWGGLRTAKEHIFALTAYGESATGRELRSKTLERFATPVCAAPQYFHVSIISGVSTEEGVVISCTAGLKWRKSPGANGYHLYRATSSDRTYRRFKTITNGGTQSCNVNLDPEVDTYFKIVPYRGVRGDAAEMTVKRMLWACPAPPEIL